MGSPQRKLTPTVRLEFASQRKLRARNKPHYRLAHWPIWITVFYLAPGPMTFSLFAYGVNRAMAVWLAVVIVGTGIAALRGRLPGVEPAPYIIRFTEDRPNPLYRRVCYTVAWGELIAYMLLNFIGLLDAVLFGTWHLKQIYWAAYLPVAGAVWTLGAMGKLPRVKASTRGEGDERRWFYAMVWAVPPAQCVLWALWTFLPRGRWEDTIRLLGFTATLVIIWSLSARGLLPRTRKIVPGELAVSD
jgi:hypothetical protein